MRFRLNLDQLEQLLGSSRLSQNHWALKLGLSRGHWSDIVNGKHPFPSASTRERMLEVFGAAQEDLFIIEDETRPLEFDFKQAISSRYEITNELGHGGMGTVYLANDRALGRLVAIKVVAAEAVAGIGADQLLLEIANVSRLQHPNILSLFEAGERGGSPYYVMPYVRDGSLGAKLRDAGRFSIAAALPIIEGLSRALEHAHSRQLLHCDIKPENILLQGDHPFLMDFGIARKLHSEASEWIGVRKGLDYSAGTPAYVSPEQAAGDRHLDQRSDVYSFACVVYEMLTGRAPFIGSTTQEVVSQRFRAPPPSIGEFAPEVPSGVARVVERAMSVDPERRPVSAHAFANQVRASAQSASAIATSLSITMSRTIGWFRSRSGARGSQKYSFPFAGMVGDLRYVSRALVRNARFAMGVILSLGLGVGLGLPVLSIADHLFLRPPPGVADPDRVASLIMRSRSNDGSLFYSNALTGLDYTATNTRATTLESVAGWSSLSLSLGRGDNSRSITTTLASASFFSVLGVRPFLGRFYTDVEDVEGSTGAPCVISYRFWKTYLNGAADALGKTLQIGTVIYTIAGIAPEGFNGLGLNSVDAWLPLHVATPEFQGRDPKLWTTDQSAWLRIIARFKTGVSIEAATADANRAYYSERDRVRKPDIASPMLWDPVQPGRSSMPNQSARIALWLSGGGVMLLLLIAANLVNLFLARSAANVRQVAIRLAIGGGRRQLFRLNMLEALVLGVSSAALGLAISVPAVRAARELIFPGVVWVRPAVDIRIGLLALAITLAVGAVIAIWTSWHAGRVDPAELLRSAGSAQMAGTRRSHAARRVLLVAQGAMMALLVSGAAAFVLSLRRASVVDVGFDLNSVISATIPLSAANTTAEQSRALYQRAHEQVSALPDVASASLGYMEPWYNNRFENVSVPGSAIKPPYLYFDVATPEYLRTFGATMREGRWINANDRSGSAPVVVVNEALAKIFWSGSSAIGNCLRIGADSMPCRTIVGIVRDFRVTGGVDGPMQPAYYIPVAQAEQYNWRPKLFFRARGDVRAATNAVRHALQNVQPDLPFIEMHPLTRNVSWLTSRLQLGTAVFTAFGFLAVAIAALGLYSVLSFLVVEQRRSHAIKVALGASRMRVALPVVRQSFATVALGLALGFIAVRALSPAFESMLFHTQLNDGIVVAVVSALGIVVTLLATLVPVRRVLRTNAMSVLRDQ